MAARRSHEAAANDGPPRKPGELGTRSWLRALGRTVREFQNDNLTDWAAALTYYSVLSIFPAMIALVAIIGLAGQHPQTTNALLGIIDDIGPSSAVDTFRGPIESLITNKGGASVALVVGLGAALWTASGYIGAFMRASNRIYDVEEQRSFWKRRPLQLLVTLVMLLLVALVGIAIVLTGPLAHAVAKPLGLGGAALTAWSIAKWPVLLLVVMLMISGLYYVAPSVRPTGFRWVTPGSVLAVLLWILASAAFALYVSNFGSFNKTYGSLGGVVVFLVWVWISNVAVLLGAELNSELERGRQLATGADEAGRKIHPTAQDAPAKT